MATHKEVILFKTVDRPLVLSSTQQKGERGADPRGLIEWEVTAELKAL